MRRNPFSFCLIVILLLTHSAWLYAGRGEPPRSWHAEQALENVARIQLPAIDPQQKLTEDENTPGPLRFASPIEVDQTPNDAGTWETLADGSLLWRLRYQVPGATDLNFGFSRFFLPQGATLLIDSETQAYFQGPFTSKHNKKHGQLWTPIVPGDSAVLELHLPAGSEKKLKLKISQVNAGYRSLFQGKSPAKQGSCEIDTSCPEGDAWRDDIRSVARLSIGGLYLCTGTMIMDAQGSFRNFMVSANHCSFNSANASSLVVYWNYESPSCGQLGGGDLWANTQSGATLLASRKDVDFALLELDDTPLPEFNVYYAGWDRTGATPSGSIGIHHPDGDEKAISINSDPLSTADNCIAFVDTPNTHWALNWELGVTEVGSSGSGLWSTDNHKLVGFLSGGDSSCGNPHGNDCYGKFAVAWDGPDASSRLRDWLDPTATKVMFVNGANSPNVTAPANDNIADSIEISGDSGRISGTNRSATLEFGEPNHAGVNSSSSVWWRWTVPESGTATIDTIGSNFDTVLAVYTADIPEAVGENQNPVSVDLLQAVAANNDHQDLDLSSWLQFKAAAGTTYYISVSGFNRTAASNIVLNWNIFNLDAFLLYDLRPLSTLLPSFGPITLQDALFTSQFDVSKGKRIGLAAKVDDEDAYDLTARLFEYPVKLAKGAPRFQKKRYVRVANACSDLELRLVNPRTVLLPAASGELPVNAPAANGLDHYLCYDAAVERKDPNGNVLPGFPKNLQVEVADALQTLRYDLRRITRYCDPVDKSGEPSILRGADKGMPFPITPATVAKPNGSLLCYQATLATRTIEQNGCGPAANAKKTRIRPRQALVSPASLYIADQFETSQFQIVKPKELCIPSIRSAD